MRTRQVFYLSGLSENSQTEYRMSPPALHTMTIAMAEVYCRGIGMEAHSTREGGMLCLDDNLSEELLWKGDPPAGYS